MFAGCLTRAVTAACGVANAFLDSQREMQRQINETACKSDVPNTTVRLKRNFIDDPASTHATAAHAAPGMTTTAPSAAGMRSASDRGVYSRRYEAAARARPRLENPRLLCA